MLCSSHTAIDLVVVELAMIPKSVSHGICGDMLQILLTFNSWFKFSWKLVLVSLKFKILKFSFCIWDGEKALVTLPIEFLCSRINRFWQVHEPKRDV